jgi:hypothetical protein
MRDAAKMPGMIDDLKNAIIDDAFQRVEPNQNQSVKALGNEIIAEITHLANTMPPEISRGLLIGLLYDDVFERLKTFPRDQNRTPPAPTRANSPNESEQRKARFLLTN